MSDIEITIGGLCRGLDSMTRDWPNLRRDALEGAILNGGLLDAIWQRTPKSMMQRYASQLGGISISPTGALSKGWRKKLDPRILAHVERYGQERLARSLMPHGNRPGSAGMGLDIETTSDGAVWRIRSSISYAEKVHEARSPREGQYWSPGEGRGWTTPGTGAKYLSRPAEECAGRIARELARNLSSAIEGRFRA